MLRSKHKLYQNIVRAFTPLLTNVVHNNFRSLLSVFSYDCCCIRMLDHTRTFHYISSCKRQYRTGSRPSHTRSRHYSFLLWHHAFLQGYQRSSRNTVFSIDFVQQNQTCNDEHHSVLFLRSDDSNLFTTFCLRSSSTTFTYIFKQHGPSRYKWLLPRCVLCCDHLFINHCQI